MTMSLTRRQDRTGFTLIELLVVMGVITILVALLVPTIGKVREQVHIASVETTIGSLSMALEEYKTVHHRYPPDEHPGLKPHPPGTSGNPRPSFLITSSQCLVYYLSGGSIYDDSSAGYPWTNNLYQAGGREDLDVYYEFEPARLKDFGDHAPALVDPWGNPLIYNAGPSTDPQDPPQAPDPGDWPASSVYNRDEYNMYGAAKHGEKKFDLFSAGPDRVYGTPDDITNWRDERSWGYDNFSLNEGQ